MSKKVQKKEKEKVLPKEDKTEDSQSNEIERESEKSDEDDSVDNLSNDSDYEQQPSYTSNFGNNVQNPSPGNFRENHCPKKPETSSRKWIYMVIFLVFAVILSKFSNFYENHPNNEEFIEQFSQTVPEIGRATLKNVIKKIDSSTDSAIILLLIGNENQGEQLKNLSHSLADFIFKLKYLSYNFIFELINQGPKYPIIQFNSTFTARDIEENYQKAFGEEQAPVMVMEDLQLMSPKIAMTFHQFVDKDQSKILSSFSIITLKRSTVDFPIQQNMSLKEVEKISSKALSDLWGNVFVPDELDCLINRFAEYSVVLMPN